MNQQAGFALYPEELRWWSFNDYGAVLQVMQRLGPRRVLEFGPGSSTLALIEGGATHIDSCEDDPVWFNTYTERLQKKYPRIVTLRPYTWSDPVTVPGVDDKVYDLALIDGPHGTEARVPVIEYCIARCAAVLVPLEEVAYGKGALRDPVTAFAKQYNLDVELMDTGPLSGTFALLS